MKKVKKTDLLIAYVISSLAIILVLIMATTTPYTPTIAAQAALLMLVGGWYGLGVCVGATIVE